MMNNNPKISVVTVCYNAVDTIENTIVSVLNQTYSNIEYIIIDGASTDGTVEIIKKYQSRFARFMSEPDMGIYDAMNKGVKVATGEWINYMNSGDVFYNDNVISSIFEKVIDDDVSFIFSDFYSGSTKCFASYEKGILNHQSIFYKKNKHNEYGLYAVTKKYIISDYMFFLRFNLSEVYKTDVVISRNSIAGVSGTINCFPQKLCGDFIYGKISFVSLVVNLCLWRVKSLLKTIFNKFAHF